MEGITPRQISNFHSNAMHVGLAQNEGKQVKADQARDPKDEVSLRSLVNYSADDLTPQGTVKVIIEADNNEKLAMVKEKIGQENRSRHSDDLPIITGLAAEIDPNDKGVIAVLQQAGARVTLDGEISIIPPVEETPLDEVNSLMDVAGETMNLKKIWDMGYTGKDMTIAVIDTGIAKHPDFEGKIVDFKDYVNGRDGVENYYDDNKHGTHCASIAAGTGKASGGKFVGAAPDANLVGIKVLSGSGSGSYSNIIKSLQYVIEYNEKNPDKPIHIASMSLGGTQTQLAADDPVVQAVHKVIDKGVFVAIAGGNSGPYAKTIGTPGSSPLAMTFGASDDKGTVDPSDDTVARFSSRGPTKDGLVKPDILTPGVNITAANNNGSGYVSLSGTSMATPLGAGMAALLLQAAPGTTPQKLKEVIMETANPMKDITPNDQGAGVFDLVEAFEKLTGKQVEKKA